IAFKEASIGRVLTSIDYRNFGYGRKLMELAVRFILDRFDCKKITISAQLYLEKFYASIGFITIGDAYLEDNIPHIKMQLGYKSSAPGNI
ncbi:MAG: GNAT family N-acetyltransferase, partial [Ferruginibacter sp.]